MAADKILVDPQRLVYVGPFDEPRVCELRLVNPSEQPVIFKMKSTRPDRFKIRPVYGCIDPNGSSCPVRIVCRPFDESRGIPTKDRVTAVLLQTPSAADRASLVWKRMGMAELRNCRRIVLPVTYVKILREEERKSTMRSDRHMQLLSKKIELLKQLEEVTRELDTDRQYRHRPPAVRRRSQRSEPYELEAAPKQRTRVVEEDEELEQTPKAPPRRPPRMAAKPKRPTAAPINIKKQMIREEDDESSQQEHSADAEDSYDLE